MSGFFQCAFERAELLQGSVEFFKGQRGWFEIGFFKEKSRGAGRVVLGGGDGLVFREGKPGDFKESLTDYRGAELGDSLSVEPARHEWKLGIAAFAKEVAEESDFFEARVGPSQGKEKLAEGAEIAIGSREFPGNGLGGVC